MRQTSTKSWISRRDEVFFVTTVQLTISQQLDIQLVTQWPPYVIELTGKRTFSCHHNQHDNITLVTTLNIMPFCLHVDKISPQKFLSLLQIRKKFVFMTIEIYIPLA